MNASPPSLAEQFNEMPIKSPSKPLLPLYRLCEHCSSPFYSRGGYQAHLRQKHSAQERPFHCDICLQNFTTARYLKSHLTSRHHVNRTDSDLVVYQCDHHHCLFVCTKAAGMLAHRRLAHQEKHEKKSNKEVKCEGCGCHFSAVSLYRTHLCRALKPFKCTRCPKTYPRECHLSKHMAKVHPVEEGGDNGYDGDDEKEEEDTEDTDEEKTDTCSSLKSFADVYFAAEQEEDISECLVNAFLSFQTKEKANFEEMDLLANQDNLEDLSTPTYHLLQPANVAEIDATLVKVLEAVNEGRLDIEVLQPSLEMEL